MRKWLMAVLALGVLLPGTGAADVLEVSPAEIVALTTVDGSARVAMKFDLSGLRQGKGRQIDNAVLEWTLPASVSTNYEVVAFSPGSQWTQNGVALGTEPEEADHLDSIILGSRNVKNDEVTVRLGLRDLVSGWADGTSQNHGIIVTTRDLTKTTLESNLDKPKLKIWYGFAE